MVILDFGTKQERLEVMVWAAGNGPQTAAVRRFILRKRMTVGIALITRGDWSAAAARN